MPPTLEMSPFPTLTFHSGEWFGVVVLPTWAGFKPGQYVSGRSPDASSGEIEVCVSAYGSLRPPSAGQAAAFLYLLQNEKAVTDSVLKAIFERYPKFREEVFRGSSPTPAALEWYPEQLGPEQLRSLVGPVTVHVSEGEHEGRAVIGFEFGCDCEPIYGLRVLTHGDRVLAVGGGEISFWLGE